MKRKNMFLLISSLFIFLISLSLVSAFDVTIDIPTTGSTLSGDNTTTLNITIGDLGSGEVMNCSMYTYSVGNTANTTVLQMQYQNGDIYYLHNTSANQPTFNDSLASDILDNYEDGIDYIMFASCTNSTNDNINSSTITGLTIDYTIPTVPILIGPASGITDKDKIVTFSATVNDSSTTGCSLTLGVDTYSMSKSGTTCTTTLKNIAERQYTWRINALDGTNSSGSSSRNLKVNKDSSAAKTTLFIYQQSEEFKRTGQKPLAILGVTKFTNNAFVNGVKNNLLIILGVLVVGVVVWFVKFKKK